MTRILIVEDEVIVGLALREELIDLGATVDLQHDAEDALARLAEQTFHAAIIDIALPGMRGDAFALECRARWPEMPVLLATGMALDELPASIVTDSKVAVLAKPYGFAAVQVTLEALGVRFGIGAARGDRS